MEPLRWQLGDISRDQFEADRENAVDVGELRIGSTYTLRMSFPPIGATEYISDYPVQVADTYVKEGLVEVELVHLEPRDESWRVGPGKVILSNEGSVIVDNTGPHRIEGWDEGIVEVGYLLIPGPHDQP